MQGGFKSIQKAPSEDSVVWIWHINNIECDVFCARVLGVPKDTGV
jgi:hypothetical protein